MSTERDVPVPAPDQRGYRVNLESGMVHLRYAPHARNTLKTGTPRGVLNLLGDTKPKACKTCFPHGTRRTPQLEASPGQRRRTP